MEATSGARPLSVGEIVTNFGDEMREVLLARYGLPPDLLAERYAQVRDNWIAEDCEGWLEAHRFHTEVADALRACVARQDATVYVYTTKPKRCAPHTLSHATALGRASQCTLRPRPCDTAHALLTPCLGSLC